MSVWPVQLFTSRVFDLPIRQGRTFAKGNLVPWSVSGVTILRTFLCLMSAVHQLLECNLSGCESKANGCLLETQQHIPVSASFFGVPPAERLTLFIESLASLARKQTTLVFQRIWRDRFSLVLATHRRAVYPVSTEY